MVGTGGDTETERVVRSPRRERFSGRSKQRRRARVTAAWRYALGRAIVRLMFWLLIGPRVSGLDHVPASGPLLVVGNHVTFLEPPLITALLPRRVTFLALYDLFDIRWLAWMLRFMGVLPVKRGGTRDLDALRAAVDLLRQGEAVGIFPEGTRSGVPGLLRANPGVSLLAHRTGAPVLPVAVTGTDRLERAGAFLLARWRGPRVRVVIGEPFTPEIGAGKIEHQAVADAILARVAALLPPAYRGYYG